MSNSTTQAVVNVTAPCTSLADYHDRKHLLILELSTALGVEPSRITLSDVAYHNSTCSASYAVSINTDRSTDFCNEVAEALKDSILGCGTFNPDGGSGGGDRVISPDPIPTTNSSAGPAAPPEETGSNQYQIVIIAGLSAAGAGLVVLASAMYYRRKIAITKVNPIYIAPSQVGPRRVWEDLDNAESGDEQISSRDVNIRNGANERAGVLMAWNDPATMDLAQQGNDERPQSRQSYASDEEVLEDFENFEEDGAILSY